MMFNQIPMLMILVTLMDNIHLLFQKLMKKLSLNQFMEIGIKFQLDLKNLYTI